MKEIVNIRLYNGKLVEIMGNKHTLKLQSGEEIKVVTDKRQKFWYVTHCESGLNLVPLQYYNGERVVEMGDCYLMPTTERDALEIVRFTLDGMYNLHGKKLSDIWEERKKQLKIK